MVDKPQAPIDIRFGQLGVLQLRFRTLDPGVILDELRGRFSSAPQFFRRAAVCIDLLTVKQKTGSSTYDTLSTMTYNSSPNTPPSFASAIAKRSRRSCAAGPSCLPTIALSGFS